MPNYRRLMKKGSMDFFLDLTKMKAKELNQCDEIIQNFKKNHLSKY